MQPHTQTIIDAALDRNDVAAAATHAQTALDAGERDPMLLNLAAWLREERGDFAGAHELLHEALLLAPGDPMIVVAIGVVQRKEGQLSKAVASFDAALELDPDFATAWLERAIAFDAGGAHGDALEDYRRAAALDPGCTPAYAGIASIAARRGDRALAIEAGEHALAQEPRNPIATCALALVELERGEPAQTIARLERLVAADDGSGDGLVPALTLLGDAFEKIGDAQRAYDAYARAQNIFARFHRSRLDPRRAPHTDFIRRIDRALAVAAPAIAPQWSAPAIAGAAPQHIFLLGYPRSGTTLVENVLASAPGVEALEERPTLQASDRAFLDDEDGLTRLYRADDAALQPLREDYWNRVARAGIDTAAATFVDMDPFKGTRLPLIARLFPAARVVLMRRDPRDVVWSCFHTHFRFSDATLDFTTLEATARHYDASMQVIERAIATLPIAPHILRYKELVTAFEPTTRALCDHVGIAWTPELLRFDRTAQRRGVSTASQTQVRKGLYDGSGTWRFYAAQLAPVLPILQPWVERFGFEP